MLVHQEITSSDASLCIVASGNHLWVPEILVSLEIRFIILLRLSAIKFINLFNIMEALILICSF